jgi:hypothetical protein
VQLPSGTVATSPGAFQQAWNSAASNGVATISSWNQMPVAGVTASIANLGGNIRVVLASATPTAPINVAILAWLPVSQGQEAAQNEMYRAAFDVLMKTVNPNVTSAQQTRVANELGLTPQAPPFQVGTTANAVQPPQAYRLEALQPDSQSGVETMIAVTEVPS